MGLNLVQYNYEKLISILPKDLVLMHYGDETHITPTSSKQSYIYFSIKKTGSF